MPSSSIFVDKRLESDWRMGRPTEDQRRSRATPADVALADMSIALGHPVRIQILRILAGQGPGCYCGNLVQEIGLAQSTVSHHLKILREAGFITATGSGTAVCYCLDAGPLRRLSDMILSLVPDEEEE